MSVGEGLHTHHFNPHNPESRYDSHFKAGGRLRKVKSPNLLGARSSMDPTEVCLAQSRSLDSFHFLLIDSPPSILSSKCQRKYFACCKAISNCRIVTILAYFILVFIRGHG